MRLDADWTHAGATTTMRNAEGLVQIEVADVGADITRTGKPDHGVHVGTVQIDLSAMLVHDVADFANRFFKHAVGGRIGDHAAREVFRILLCFCTEIVYIDITVFLRPDRNDLHADHLCGGRVGAMCRRWDKADIAMRITTSQMVIADRQQARILALRAGIWLHGEGVVSGHSAELGGEIVDHFLVAQSLIGWDERMDVGEFRPGDRQHFRGCVQLHGAGTERDHRPVERQIAVRKTTDVTRHFAFGAVHVEDRVRHVSTCTQ